MKTMVALLMNTWMIVNNSYNIIFITILFISRYVQKGFKMTQSHMDSIIILKYDSLLLKNLFGRES